MNQQSESELEEAQDTIRRLQARIKLLEKCVVTGRDGKPIRIGREISIEGPRGVVSRRVIYIGNLSASWAIGVQSDDPREPIWYVNPAYCFTDQEQEQAENVVQLINQINSDFPLPDETVDKIREIRDQSFPAAMRDLADAVLKINYWIERECIGKSETN